MRRNVFPLVLQRLLGATLLSAAIFISPGIAASTSSDVVVTIKPLHSLVAAVMGETDIPTLIVDGYASPHTYSLKPSQVKTLQNARVVFYIDESFETFLDPVLKNLPKRVLHAGVGEKASLTVLTHRKGGAWEAHLHDAHEHAGEKEHPHDEEKHDEDGHHAKHDSDPHGRHHEDMHLWLDPANAQRIVTYIAKELGKIYPENAAVYQRNAATATAALKDLDGDLRQTLTPVKDKPFIVFHDAYQYLERAYGLTAVGSIALDPTQEVSAKRLKDMRQKLRETDTVCVFREPQFSSALVETVIEGTTVRSATLDPDTGVDIPASPSMYPTLMRRLADAIADCLQTPKKP
jgi:zinc transport system substrate-binding protein